MDSKKIYFIGIGGIGMSALARFFLAEDWKVGGYDRTESQITRKLESLGAEVIYDDNLSLVSECFLETDTLIVYTPAIPKDSNLLLHFLNGEYNIMKRAAALGKLSEGKFLMAVAGSHGKSTTSTMTAYFNAISANEGSAFLGAISKNFDSNLVIGTGDRLVVEADEFDRSFLHLRPDAAVITAVDPDHLDIYGTAEAYREGFSQFIDCIKPGGRLILKKNVDVPVRNRGIKVFSYSASDQSADYHASNIEVDNHGFCSFDLVTPHGTIPDCKLGVPGIVNVENAVGAAALVDSRGLNSDLLREAMRTFKGIKRRFDFYLNSDRLVYMDDYAHHPGELETMIDSVRHMFPGRKLTVAFQPHLFTRTRDFADGFSKALSKADRVWLLPIYPARELPIEGVSSEMLCSNITVPCEVVQYNDLVSKVREQSDLDLFVTAGAGDIDRLVLPIRDALSGRIVTE